MRCLIALLVLCFTGCGTMQNLEGKEHVFLSSPGQKPVRIYGGVRNDLEWLAEGIRTDSDSSITYDPIEYVYGIPIIGYLGVIDPVLSLVADTATLPFVLKSISDANEED